jgi:hypothetical protein
VAKWDGPGWTSLGTGTNGQVYALAVYDDGSGPALYVGGIFTTAGGVAASRIARWDGVSWSALGAGINSSGAGTPAVHTLTVYDDGSGPALHAGGTFTTAGGMAANGVAKWNGSGWSSLGVGVSGGEATFPAVYSLAVYDDGGGPALYAGGTFASAGSVAVNRIARWNGSDWAALGTGVSGGVVPEVHSLAVYDDGSGPALYVGGRFRNAGAVMDARGVARWNGSSWAPLGGGMIGLSSVSALAVYDDGSGPALHAGGDYHHAADSRDHYLAKWAGCPDSAPPKIVCPEGVVVKDRPSSLPGEIMTFTVTATDNMDPAPVVVCVPPSGSLFPRGTTVVTCTATDELGNKSTCEFEVTVLNKARW